MALTLLQKRRKSMEKARASRNPKTKMPSGDARRKVIAAEPIDPEKMYAADLIPERLGISRRAIDRAIADGLKSKRIGGKEFVLGKWIISHFAAE